MLSAEDIGAAVRSAIGEAAVTLRSDVLSAIEQAATLEPSGRGREVLLQIAKNAGIASELRVPLCQDTGTVWVWVELGAKECIRGDLSLAVDSAVSRAYRENALRMSVVGDPLFDRTNTGDNTPAVLDVTTRPGAGATVHVMLKGGGSDNASALAMLEPAQGVEGVRRTVVDAVARKGANACPPLVVGVGVGGTFDTVAKLSKRALLREVGSASGDPRIAALEKELKDAVNALGIGPGGLGGRTTALAVPVLTAPCHIAALPVAVNLGCCAMRSVSLELA